MDKPLHTRSRADLSTYIGELPPTAEDVLAAAAAAEIAEDAGDADVDEQWCVGCRSRLES